MGKAALNGGLPKIEIQHSLSIVGLNGGLTQGKSQGCDAGAYMDADK